MESNTGSVNMEVGGDEEPAVGEEKNDSSEPASLNSSVTFLAESGTSQRKRKICKQASLSCCRYT